MSKQDKVVQNGCKKDRDRKRDRKREEQRRAELFQEKRMGRLRSKRTTESRGRSVRSVFSPLEVAVGARQGCVGFGYLVSPLGPPLLPLLAAVAAAAAAAAAVHSVSPRLRPYSSNLFLFPPSFSRRCRAARSPIAHLLSLTLFFFCLIPPDARLSTVLLVFLTKDPLNTSAVITSRQPSRVARLPQQTHPSIQASPRVSMGPTNRRATT